MTILRVFLMLMLGLSAAACSKFPTYSGPEVTHVLVNKGERRMHLIHHNEVLKSYDVGLGFAPVGDKKIEGDGKTPEGSYTIDRRNPNSQFYLSIGVSYPNKDDRAEAKELGKSPGGDIFIHGRPRKYRKGGQDWTAGCIAVTNREMREVYSMVKNGTPITITP
ncbi:L,D-transpeptidase family protein [Mameliella sediminis]|uniref:L,D-transpeptidase family protein n=1 Tax=Mameliella sediminis TaxID=2836866 RepID=UPI001C4828C7|nr:L,D-transpeptidase family protein [Mameliella sediminis]MBY6113983.1 L,D-transpeptidase family protein [Antarctobacter heliothermus]MBY6142669.1 L,D-transpeptidase family protein [Mameliella alba]MBV7395280.1 L,D-transpeptidase family protein [Mameliella sediminis]MBY6159524.1 L,D-transpeptidase family protein [Mameliella alba]MBY6167995.1 L,D-transpeptidase family protein [Mameliella alba]